MLRCSAKYIEKKDDTTTTCLQLHKSNTNTLFTSRYKIKVYYISLEMIFIFLLVVANVYTMRYEKEKRYKTGEWMGYLVSDMPSPISVPSRKCSIFRNGEDTTGQNDLEYGEVGRWASSVRAKCPHPITAQFPRLTKGSGIALTLHGMPPDVLNLLSKVVLLCQPLAWEL